MRRLAPLLLLLVLVASPVAASPADDLKALGVQVRASLTRGLLPASGNRDAGELPVFGTCVRPTADQRAALRARILRRVGTEAVNIELGCVERIGIVLDVSYDRRGPTGGLTGVWEVVRASAPTADATLTPLRHYEGTSTQDFMEWADEHELHTQVLVDVDRDGLLDALLVDSQHEGGSPHHHVQLHLWRSSTATTSEVGAYDNVAYLVQPAPRGPFVVAGQPPTSDGKAAIRYACLAPTGKVSLCPDVVAARRRERKAEIASWFVDGHTYDLGDSQPDRELLAALLDELEVPAATRAPLLAAAPPTSPRHRVAREVARVLAPRPPTRYGEIVDAPVAADPRAARLATLLGDTPCTGASASAAGQLTAWIAAHDPAAIAATAAAPRCSHGATCTFRQPSPPAITECPGRTADAAGVVFATWTYTDLAADTTLIRSAVFRRGASLTEVVSAAATRAASVCVACDDHAGEVLGATLYRHAGHAIALVSNERNELTVVVDGGVGPAPPAGAARASLREPAVALGDVAATSAPRETTYWHFDGARWQSIVTVPFGDAATAPADAPPAARLLFDADQRAFGRWSLQSFDANAWAVDPAARAALRRDLVRAGADAATLARVDAEAARVP